MSHTEEVNHVVGVEYPLSDTMELLLGQVVTPWSYSMGWTHRDTLVTCNSFSNEWEEYGTYLETSISKGPSKLPLCEVLYMITNPEFVRRGKG